MVTVVAWLFGLGAVVLAGAGAIVYFDDGHE
jgi:hypothetical protein